MRYEIEEKYRRFLEWYVKQKDLRPMRMDVIPKIKVTEEEKVVDEGKKWFEAIGDEALKLMREVIE